MALDVRIALRLPHLVLDLLLGHLQVLGVLPLLVDHVQHTQQQQDGDEPQRHVQDYPRDLEHDRQGIQVRQHHDLVAVLPHREHDHGQDDDRLDDAQAGLEQAVEAENAFEPAERVQLGEPGAQELR
jgi:energy-converting hydrogenase Eha subunit F